jgi:hypothetical protein
VRVIISIRMRLGGGAFNAYEGGEGICGGINLIELAQNRDRWREIVNAVMNLRVP